MFFLGCVLMSHTHTNTACLRAPCCRCTPSLGPCIIPFYFLSAVTARQPICVIKMTLKQFAANIFSLPVFFFLPMHTCTLWHVKEQKHSHTPPHMHSCTRARTHARKYAHKNIPTHAHRRTRTHTHTHTPTNAQVHTHMCMHIHTDTHAHIQTHTHTHTHEP